MRTVNCAFDAYGERAMRTSVYVLAALAAAGLTTASAQNAGNPANPPGTQTPVQQPRTSAPPSAPTPAPRNSPTPSQPTQPSSQATTPAQPTQTTQPAQSSQTSPPAQPRQTTQQAQPNSNTQQTVRPPDSARTDANRRTNDDDNANNAARQNQSRVPPAMRGVGTTGSRPDCTKLRGIEKAECERRDTSRDDLPAGVTTTQPERPQE